jgi:hypothetical protein
MVAHLLQMVAHVLKIVGHLLKMVTNVKATKCGWSRENVKQTLKFRLIKWVIMFYELANTFMH